MRTHSSGRGPGQLHVLVVRGDDAQSVWTWIAVAGLVIAVLLAIVGLPRVDIHGPLHYLGVMDPLCGGTRSVYLTMHGHLRDPLRYNPASLMLVVAAAALLMRAALGWATGHFLSVHVPRRLLIPVMVVALVALEVNQQLHAGLLTKPCLGA
ncbi:MAG: hypothetical protein QOF66_7392 [Mycobacterium sp.]|nr:hypothetical protein [Mycobacterium sp.]